MRCRALCEGECGAHKSSHASLCPGLLWEQCSFTSLSRAHADSVACIPERQRDWMNRFELQLGLKICQMTGDSPINYFKLQRSHVIMSDKHKCARRRNRNACEEDEAHSCNLSFDFLSTTPEKWDAVRSSSQRLRQPSRGSMAAPNLPMLALTSLCMFVCACDFHTFSRRLQDVDRKLMQSIGLMMVDGESMQRRKSRSGLVAQSPSLTDCRACFFFLCMQRFIF